MPLNLITEKIYDVSSNEETIIEREETKEEAKARLNNEKIAKAYAEAQAKADADKAANLALLGLTEDELKTILG